MVKICSYCNAENPDLNNNCQSCGRDLLLSQSQTISQKEIICTNCGRATSSDNNNCPQCGTILSKVNLTRREQPISHQQSKKFKWWKLFTWPFTCLGTLLTGCCGCCCGACCESGSSSTSLKEEVAEEAIDKVLDLFTDD
ncbi:MAG: hypothetical protein GPJ52_10720 [Candidatus Heimdallarchaeota archaeon]|nr:hypothetical protein [Candidatus Heimdallarchaeota archaeon]